MTDIQIGDPAEFSTTDEASITRIDKRIIWGWKCEITFTLNSVSVSMQAPGGDDACRVEIDSEDIENSTAFCYIPAPKSFETSV